jgi:acyl carrier protein
VALSERAQLQSDVRELIARILELPLSPSVDVLRRDTREWDSLKHMEIVFALEDRFGVTFDESEFSALDSCAAIAAAVRRHLEA